MLNKPKQCQGCPLFLVPNSGFSMPEGNCNNGVLVVGEALGQNEKYDALPLRPYAEAGSVLQTVFRRLTDEGIKNCDRLDFALWNLIACQPPANKLENMPFEHDAIMHCRIHFQEVLRKYYGKIKCVLALGNLPLRYLCPEIDNLVQEARLAKNKKQLKKLGSLSLRGYRFNSILGIPIVSTIHPSFIARGGRVHLHVLKRDVYFALEVAKGNIPELKTNYILEPTVKEAEEFYEICRCNPSIGISYDIETPDTVLETDETEIEYENIEVRDIISIQFSLEAGKGIFFPWMGEFITIAAKILALSNPKLGWNNWKFDETNLEYHLGKGCTNGDNLDIMYQWKHANPDFIKTGRALQFATNFFAPEFHAWKHLSEKDPKNYGCFDTDAVKRIDNGLSVALKAKRLSSESKSLYEGYIDDIVKMRPIFKHLFEIGLPIDVEAREEMRKMLVSEMRLANAKLQELYPFELRKVTPQLGYKFVPKEIDELTEEFNNICHAGNGNNYVIFGSDEVYQLYLQKFIEQKTRIRTSRKRDGTIVEKQEETTGLLLKEFNIDGTKIKRWCRLEKFKPSSTQQVLNYIKLKGYKVPTTKNYREGDKETTTKDKISELFEETGDPLFEKVVYMRELRKMKSTYVASSKKGWVLGSDNRVHAEFKPLPATGQLSSKIHNAPARGTRFSSKGYVKLANQFRKTICAGEGKLLLSGDWSAFHALTLGFEAEDPTYMRLVRLDPHSFVAAYILAQELPDKYAKIRWKKPDRMEINEWKAKVTLYEEALSKLNNLNDWINYPDDQLRDQLKWIKKNFEFTRNSQAKPAILGMGFGMKEHKFYKLNRYSFNSVKDCENLLNIIRGLFPKVFIDYHRNTLAEADRLGYLLTRYGYIRWFNDVFDWRLLTKGDPKALKLGERIVTKGGRRYHVKLGQDSNSAIAFRAANDAFGKKKEAMRELWYYENDGIIRPFISEEIRNQYKNQNLIKSFGLINEIHDDLLFEVPEKKSKDAALIVYEVMTRPAKFLKNSIEPNGLTTNVEIKIGKNWAPFHEIENPSGMKEIKI
jgi:uracil-DNA glycosylase